MIEKNNPELSVIKQSELLCIHRSGLYYKPCQEGPFNLDLIKVIDEQFLDKPFYGVSRMTEHLKNMGYLINIKRIRRLYWLMDLRTIFPAPRTIQDNKKHKKYPYLLRDLVINRPNQVWACDIIKLF
jgi:putative transposase